ncbi:F-box/kelch-repeat protein At3g23880-like [Argentina anserina]|uniref:F-box/kelch-repeat protein At3g23880-like n=1 Tax=Argentina anserina TaxID=57926 RepID=UPI00217620A3|nr:F-box/kelch-repeat protein At3g23880-like [Potentilla anserina]
MTELSKFAEEIMVEILSRLPPKSLMRFKCVRKSWQCLINNSDFAANHLSVLKRCKHPSSITLVFRRVVPEDIHSGRKDVLLSLFDLCHGVDGDDDDDHELLSSFEDLQSPLWGFADCHRFCVTIATHCDGILCLSDSRNYMVLCNPAIKEFNLLPVPSSHSNSFGDGFGYDLKSKDYKVVRILYNGHDEYEDGMNERGMRKRVVIRPPTSQVYSVLTRSWKEIKTDDLISESTTYWPQSHHSIYCNGILYWCGRERLVEEHYIVTDFSEHEDDDISGLKECIISFDIGNEAFHVILAPDDCNLYNCGFGLWKESSIAFCTNLPWSPYPSTKAIREIWVMDDLGGGEGSWTKYLTFEPEADHIFFEMGLFWYNKQLVAAFKTEWAVIFQEVCTNKFKRFPLNAGVMDYSRAVECTMSIVSINGSRY